MEKLILNEFEKINAKPNEIIMMRAIRNSLMQKLNPKQQEELINEINSLITDGYIVYEDGKNGPECLRLTEAGFQTLYVNSKSVEEIEGLIMRQFEKQRSRAGDILMMRNLSFGLLRELNPVEANLFEDAINMLLKKNFVTYETDRIECLKLTELGFNSLY